jgi:hypothetical protein
MEHFIEMDSMHQMAEKSPRFPRHCTQHSEGWGEQQGPGPQLRFRQNLSTFQGCRQPRKQIVPCTERYTLLGN